MQLLLKKLNFNIGTTQAKAEAYSPFARYIDDIENKRSKLFPDRRAIPGRKAKYILAIALLIHIYAVTKTFQSRIIYGRKARQQHALGRKVVPLFMAVQDVEYTILKHRWDLLAKEVLGE
jgi:hypothetical protein